MDRRFRRPTLEDTPRISCRVCFTRVSLDPAIIEQREDWSVVRCPTCGGSFPVRREDLPAVEAPDPGTA